ncbi:MAG TPA: hypothetical protein PKV27_08285 [Ilumatobacteraceae bacterium]|nr:hypothetical protein [Ilumatobacteraceae bacterium]
MSGRGHPNDLLLGEWACLGILYPRPVHGFAVAARLKPDGDIGRIWSLSRPLTYRSLEQLASRGLIATVGEEPGVAGGNRTVLAATRSGRAQLRGWLRRPVPHLRDLRSELLVKIVLAEQCQVEITAMLDAQRTHIETVAAGFAGPDATSVVDVWRSEYAAAALRFLQRIHPTG